MDYETQIALELEACCGEDLSCLSPSILSACSQGRLGQFLWWPSYPLGSKDQSSSGRLLNTCTSGRPLPCCWGFARMTLKVNRSADFPTWATALSASVCKMTPVVEVGPKCSNHWPQKTKSELAARNL